MKKCVYRQSQTKSLNTADTYIVLFRLIFNNSILHKDFNINTLKFGIGSKTLRF